MYKKLYCYLSVPTNFLTTFELVVFICINKQTNCFCMGNIKNVNQFHMTRKNNNYFITFSFQIFAQLRTLTTNS